MEDLKKLKKLLCKELKEYGSRTQLDRNALEMVDMLAHATKNLDKVIKCEEEEEGEGSYRSYRMSRDSYADRSYAQGGYSGGTIRDGMGQYEYNPQYTRINESGRSMDGYSRHGMADKLKVLMNESPDERTRQRLQSLVREMEEM